MSDLNRTDVIILLGLVQALSVYNKMVESMLRYERNLNEKKFKEESN